MENRSPHIIPIFITHEGCPHRCVFCDQIAITGNRTAAVSPAAIAATIEQHLRSPRKRAASEIQVAFYGGSFTGLPRSRQEELLTAVKPFIDKKLVQTVRLSTRPDYLDGETAIFLRRQGVSIVELGVQSLDDLVLEKSGRGHSVEETARAFKCLSRENIRVGAQIMLGLPGDSTASFLETIRRLVEFRPAFVRLHPTLVLKGSKLMAMHAAGQYSPLTLERAVNLCARAKELLTAAAVPVIRIGLQPSADLVANIVAGPFHPAFGELVLARVFFRQLRGKLASLPPAPPRTFHLSSRDESLVRGPNNQNLKRLAKRGLLDRARLTFQAQVPRFTIQPSESA